MADATDHSLIARSALFDADYYGRQAGVAFATRAEAIDHYARQGWRAGLATSELFDTRFYLKRNPDIRDAGMNPLAHYLRAGRREGRRPRLGRTPLAPRPSAPLEDRWRALAARGRAGAAEALEDTPNSVDVVVPVYKGLADTLACLEAVLASSNRTPFRLIVIEDSSPERELVETLQRLAGLGLITLLSNPENLGFVETANRGFGLSARRDVLLLNADTLVYGDWLDRIRAHAPSPGRVATVTPMSNNATILSYPYAPGNNNQQLELPDADLDAVFAEVNAGRSAEIPTGVGFCFYVSRAALRELGPFDVAFSPGYGEENDFCMRAQAAGWRNLAALDVFVRHTGETSFSDPVGRKAAATERLMALHPGYMPQVEAFMAADPLRPARQAVDLARARRLSAGRGVLMVEHGWGGGVERHIVELADLLRREGVVCFRLAPFGERRLQFEVAGPYDLPNLPRPDPESPDEIAGALQALDLGHAHIHSLASWPPAWFPPLLSALGHAGLSYDFTWHDYAPACPRITMVDWGGIYCERPSVDYCRVCIDKAGTRFGPVDIDAWREAYGQVLAGARRVFAPDPDVAERAGRYAPRRRTLEVRPHPLVEPPSAPIAPAADAQVRTIGVLGRIGPFKGSSVLLRLAGDALERGLPIRFRLYGSTSRAELQSFPNVEFAGEYLDDELDEQLAADPPHLLFFPSVWPETFSYTLDAALRTGLYPVCFDIGAPARRLRALERGDIMPLQLALDPVSLNERLLAIRIGDPTLASPESGRDWRSAEVYYGGLPGRRA